MIKELALRWPVIRQIVSRTDGTGVEAMSERTLTLLPEEQGRRSGEIFCPYCAVGCGQLIFHEGDRLISDGGRPGFAGISRTSLPERLRQFRTADPLHAAEES